MALPVLLLDYGAPASPAEARAFIASLLAERAVLPLPAGLRHLLAHAIAARRAGRVGERLRAVGGSPLPGAVRSLAAALAASLGAGFEVVPAFRHAAPRIRDVVAELHGRGHRRLLALPLFPQRSRTTTDVCLGALGTAARSLGIEVASVEDFATEHGFVDALAAGIAPLLRPDGQLLLVAHGLPRRLERAGDPYPARVRATAEALMERLPAGTAWSLAFQSRLGPAAWTGPYLDDELARLAREGRGDLVLAPLSFTCENLETAWDLDRDARGRAEALGIRRVVRAPAPAGHPALIEALGGLCRERARVAGWGEGEVA